MDIKEQLNAIPFKRVLDHLWIKTFYKCAWILWLCEWNNKTDWWVLNEKENLINDFTWLWRPKWDVISFLSEYLKLDFKDVLEYWKRNFNLIDTEKKDFYKKPLDQKHIQEYYNKIDIESKFNLLSFLTEEQINYLRSRWIDYEKVKDVVRNNNWIACKIYNEKWQPISINTRSIDKKEFRILAWTQSKWVYMWDIDRDNKKVYVVEWMFDFLTLRQFTKNVIWLKSVNDWIEVVKEFYNRWYEIVLIPDNDEPWKTVLEKFKDIKYSLFDLAEYNVKDINDFLLYSWLWEWIIDIIEQNRVREKENHELAYMKLLNIQKLYNERWKRWVDWPFPQLDRYTQWIIEWTVYTIWAFSNTGKSQLAYEYASYFLRKWKKVMFISTEVWIWDLLAFIARNFYRKNYYDILSWREKINIEDFKNLKLYDNVKDFVKIKELVDINKPDYLFIDFIQSIKYVWSSEYEKMSNIAVDMQDLAINKQITIFSLSQVNNESRNNDLDNLTLKWSWWLFASSDVIIWLYRKNWQTKLSIIKNKFWKTRIEFDMDINFKTWEILLFNDDLDEDF